MDKLCVVLGPTATGKTDLALDLAKKFNGELVSCDSRQVYQGLDIGTGKMPGEKWSVKKGDGWWEIEGVKIWMYDVVNFKKQYTVSGYVKDAEKIIRKIIKRKKLPIIVGGTGFYLRAILEGFESLSAPVNKSLRKELGKLSKKELQEKLKKLNLPKWEALNNSDRQNPRRLIRALELTSPTVSNKWIPAFAGMTILKIGLTAPRPYLYKKVDERVINRIKQGMLEEAKDLYQSGLTCSRMRQLGLEYGVLADYMEGKIKKFEGDQGLIKIMQGKIHGFVRRQLTWFKKEKDVHWFDVSKKDYQEKIENLVAKWYDGTN